MKEEIEKYEKAIEIIMQTLGYAWCAICQDWTELPDRKNLKSHFYHVHT